VKSIGAHAFSSCEKLYTVNGDAYDRSRGSSVSQVEKGGMEDPAFPNPNSSIGHYAFWRSPNLTSVSIPESIVMIDDCAFEGCVNLTKVKMSNSVVMIGRSAFAECVNLSDVELSDSVVFIGRKAFSGCASLSKIVLPNALSRIGEDAFIDCSNLSSVTIPKSVKIIEGFVFENCKSLKTVTVEPEIPPLLEFDIFSGSPLSVIYVPAASVEKYKTAEGWSKYADKIKAIEK
jgi:hypothetical protein